MAEALPDQLLEQVGLFVRAFGRTEAGDGGPAVPVAQDGEAARRARETVKGPRGSVSVTFEGKKTN